MVPKRGRRAMNVLDEDRPAAAMNIRTAVTRRKDGINADELVQGFVEKGYSLREVQEALQQALDKGDLHLGTGFRLFGKRIA
jgi:hypothetical protein